jgi:hypothetical protein
MSDDVTHGGGGWEWAKALLDEGEQVFKRRAPLIRKPDIDT